MSIDMASRTNREFWKKNRALNQTVDVYRYLLSVGSATSKGIAKSLVIEQAVIEEILEGCPLFFVRRDDGADFVVWRLV
jgi:hypothetical protein